MSVGDGGLSSVAVNPRTSLPQILGTLRVGLHVVFVALLVFALVRVVVDGVAGEIPAGRAWAAAVVLVVAGAVYLAGPVGEHRGVGRPAALWWLLVLLVVWTVATALSHHAVWLLFPLSFLIFAVVDRYRETGFGVGHVGVLGAAWAVGAFVPLLTGQGGGVAAVVGPGIGVVFAAVAYWSYRALVAEAERQRATADELRRTRDRLLVTEKNAGRLEERERISRDIHDTLAQGFNAVVLLSRAASTAVRHGRVDDALNQLSLIESTAGDNLNQARDLIRDLAQGTTGEPLEGVLRRIVRDVNATQRALGEGPEVVLDLRGDLHGAPLSAVVQDALVHVVKESLTNVVKHAGARRATVSLALEAAGPVLEVADDGRGITPGGTTGPGGGGYGVSGMRLRVEQAGGDLDILAGRTGAGTRVRVSFAVATQGGAG